VQHHAASRQTEHAPEFAEIAIPLRVARTFTYRLPFALRAEAKVGARALVPFRKQLVTGYIVALHERLTDADVELSEDEIREVEELIDAEPLITPQVLEITRWIADYYAAAWGEVLKAALPAGLNSSIEQVLKITAEGRDEIARFKTATNLRQAKTAKARALQILAEEDEITLHELARHFNENKAKQIARELEKRGWIARTSRARTALAKPKRRKTVALLPVEAHTDGDAARNLTDAQRRIISTLIETGGEMLFTDLLEAAKVSASAIQTLERRKIIAVNVRDVRRDPLVNALLPARDEFQLTAAQTSALQEIERALSERNYKAFLLHGVTGSGKTEIYIRAMRAALEQGRTAMMLVPEISLTPVFSRRLRSHFGERVAIFHSSLSIGERFDEWSRLKRGAASVVIGTRSAIFAPVKNLGVIIVDEEHETSYRQQEAPYYNARDVAVMRAHKERAVVVLGSATPALETFYNAQANKYKYLQLPERIANRALAQAEIIDMREAFARHQKQVTFSDELLQAIEETHARGEQAIILHNRRGYASFVLCRSCGERVSCPQCDVTLTFHRRENNLICHYCNHRARAPQRCLICGGEFIYFIGEGTEQIEEKLQKLFPTLRLARLDRDTTQRRGSYEDAILRFAAGELDMLVGTQMIAKGHDFPNVTLVGVVSIDAGLALPDFRAAERTFQLITQVAGRAGRGDLRGRVLIQTFHPEHYALRHACAQDYAGFYEQEIRHRKNLSYPPFVALASLLIHDANFTRAQQTAQELKRALDAANKQRLCRILGPAPAPLARLRGEHRLQILIKARSRSVLRETLTIALADAETKCEMPTVNVEIDPVNLM
jgi:primosomal protein N' (replication factor Y)